MGIKHYKRYEEAAFTRSVRGLVFRAPDLQDFDAGAVPSNGARMPLAGAIARGCICGEVQRPFLLSAGFELKGDHTYSAEVWNNALNSSLDTYLDGVKLTSASATFENAMVPVKLDVKPGLLRGWLEGGQQGSRTIGTAFGPLVPSLVMRSNANTQVQGNRYDYHFRNVCVCLGNDVTFKSLPSYGSVRLTINNAAPVVVNVDGNGDGSFDYGATLFPCAVLFETFDGANATGKKLGRIFVRDCYGGDVFGNTRAELPASSFSPVKFKRCELWLDPFALQGADGSAVNVWPDSSGAARDFTKLSTLAAPTLRRAQLTCPAVDFTGQVLYSNSTAHRTDNETVAIVLKPRSSGAVGYFSQCYDGASGWNLNQNGAGSLLALLPGYVGLAGGTQNVLHLVVIELDKINNRLRAWIDGNNTPALDVANTVPAYGTVTTALGAFYCNQPNANYNALLGSALIGEVIIYSKKLRDSDRQTLSNYLRAKWGNAW